MKIIKFRAWDKTEKLWLDVNWWEFWGDPTIEFVQYTGLKDKNGKEIYEGDIVRDYNGNILQVQWAYCWARYMMTYDGVTCQYYLEDYNWNKPDCLSKNMEVIGNIYENPELLKEKP